MAAAAAVHPLWRLSGLLGGSTPQLMMVPSHDTLVSSGSYGCQLQSRTRLWWYCSFDTCTKQDNTATMIIP
jgi:hypothetical protein